MHLWHVSNICVWGLTLGLLLGCFLPFGHDIRCLIWRIPVLCAAGVSLVAPAPPFKSGLLSAHLHNPLVRGVAAWLPAFLRPGLRFWGAVVKVGVFSHKALSDTEWLLHHPASLPAHINRF